MATKLPAAQKRLYYNRFVCKSCAHKVRTQSTRVIGGKVRCAKCGGKAFRPVRKK